MFSIADWSNRLTCGRKISPAVQFAHVGVGVTIHPAHGHVQLGTQAHFGLFAGTVMLLAHLAADEHSLTLQAAISASRYSSTKLSTLPSRNETNGAYLL